MSNRKRLVVVGAGGFGQEIIWAARNFNSVNPIFEICGYCDDDPSKMGANVYGSPVLGTPEDFASREAGEIWFVCAIGNNRNRSKVVKRIQNLGWQAVTVVDPSVIVAEGVEIGEGCYVGAGSILSPYATLGNHVIINHCCSIGHDSRLEDFVQISPGGRVSGRCTIKEGASLGSNAAVAPGKTVGLYSVIGACSFAIGDVPDGATVVGNPARVISTLGKKAS